MSLVIAIKDKDRIVLGADKQSSVGNNKDHLATKIWEVPNLEGALMGSVGSIRASQIIQFSDIVDKNAIVGEPTFDYVVRSLAPTIMATLNANGVKCSIPETETGDSGMCVMMPNSFLFAYKNKAWMIWHDLSVTEVDDYLAIGSGSDIARGVLFATKDKNPFERIVTAIDAAAETTVYVDDGIDVLLTEERSSDFKQFSKALGIELKKVEEDAKKIEEKTEEVEQKEEVVEEKKPETKKNKKGQSKKSKKEKEEEK